MFKLEIKTDNEAFASEPGIELALILESVARKLGRGETDGYCMDSNGNKVGTWDLTDSKVGQ